MRNILISIFILFGLTVYAGTTNSMVIAYPGTGVTGNGGSATNVNLGAGKFFLVMTNGSASWTGNVDTNGLYSFFSGVFDPLGSSLVATQGLGSAAFLPSSAFDAANAGTAAAHDATNGLRLAASNLLVGASGGQVPLGGLFSSRVPADTNGAAYLLVANTNTGLRDATTDARALTNLQASAISGTVSNAASATTAQTANSLSVVPSGHVINNPIGQPPAFSANIATQWVDAYYPVEPLMASYGSTIYCAYVQSFNVTDTTNCDTVLLKSVDRAATWSLVNTFNLSPVNVLRLRSFGVDNNGRLHFLCENLPPPYSGSGGTLVYELWSDDGGITLISNSLAYLQTGLTIHGSNTEAIPFGPYTQTPAFGVCGLYNYVGPGTDAIYALENPTNNSGTNYELHFICDTTNSFEEPSILVSGPDGMEQWVIGRSSFAATNPPSIIAGQTGQLQIWNTSNNWTNSVFCGYVGSPANPFAGPAKLVSEMTPWGEYLTLYYPCRNDDRHIYYSTAPASAVLSNAFTAFSQWTQGPVFSDSSAGGYCSVLQFGLDELVVFQTQSGSTSFLTFWHPNKTFGTQTPTFTSVTATTVNSTTINNTGNASVSGYIIASNAVVITQPSNYLFFQKINTPNKWSTNANAYANGTGYPVIFDGLGENPDGTYGATTWVISSKNNAARSFPHWSSTSNGIALPPGATFIGNGSGLTNIPPNAFSAGTTFNVIYMPTSALGIHGLSGYLTNGIFVQTGTY